MYWTTLEISAPRCALMCYPSSNITYCIACLLCIGVILLNKFNSIQFNSTFYPTNPAVASHFVKPSFFILDRISVANYIILCHTSCITLVQALTVMRLVSRFPAKIETRRQESTFVVRKLFLAILHSQNVRQ